MQNLSMLQMPNSPRHIQPALIEDHDYGRERERERGEEEFIGYEGV
jgi:hypothetical protein